MTSAPPRPGPPLRTLSFALVASFAAACGSSDGGEASPSPAGGSSYATCEAGKRAGTFVVSVSDPAEPDAVDITGSVYDAPITGTKTQVAKTAGSCSVLTPVQAEVCPMTCSSSEVCVNKVCKAGPKLKSVGAVTVAGLGSAIKLEQLSDKYSMPLDAHPKVVTGGSITVTASGAEGYGPLTAKASGVDFIKLPPGTVEVVKDKPVKLTWTPPAKAVPGARVLINLSINKHGLTESWIECDTADTGEVTIDAGLVTELFKYGMSGFPRASITRQSAGTASVPSGCVELDVMSQGTQALKNPLVQDCSDDSECPAGKKCGRDQACK